MPFILLATIFLTAIPVLCGVKPALAQEDTVDIHSPFLPVFSEKRSIPPHSCDKPPLPPEKMEYKSVYTDRSEGVSIVDEEAKARYKEQIQEITAYEKQIASWTEKIIARKASESDYCAIDWMISWASQDALLNLQATSQGEAVRKWFLATIATHYDILSQNVEIPKDAQTELERWIEALTIQVIKDYSRKTTSNSRLNNHIYWTAWAVMMASTILDNQQYYDWALERAERGILEIQHNGILPRELARQRRAFAYHVFATTPLIMIAETVARNDGDLYNQNAGGLHRLVSFIISELNNKQATLTALTGRQQKTKTAITNYSLAWLRVYNTRFPSSKAEKWIKKLEPMKLRRIGGNMDIIFAPDAQTEK